MEGIVLLLVTEASFAELAWARADLVTIVEEDEVVEVEAKRLSSFRLNSGVLVTGFAFTAGGMGLPLFGLEGDVGAATEGVALPLFVLEGVVGTGTVAGVVALLEGGMGVATGIGDGGGTVAAVTRESGEAGPSAFPLAVFGRAILEMPS